MNSILNAQVEKSYDSCYIAYIADSFQTLTSGERIETYGHIGDRERESLDHFLSELMNAFRSYDIEQIVPLYRFSSEVAGYEERKRGMQLSFEPEDYIWKDRVLGGTKEGNK